MEGVFGKFLSGKSNDVPDAQARNRVEESRGLHRFYTEIASSETRKQNFEVWRSHLSERLERRFPDTEERSAALAEASAYMSSMPIVHGAKYEFLKHSTLPYISSAFSIHASGEYERLRGAVADSGISPTNSNHFDKEHELDHFIYCRLGLNFITGYSAYFCLDSSFLGREGVVVALEDWADTKMRIARNDYQPELDATAFDIHLRQMWDGKDFIHLFPMMLAYAYQHPETYDNAAAMPKDIIPPGLPSLAGAAGVLPYFPKIEVRIPETVSHRDIRAVFVEESSLHQENYRSNSIVVIPLNLSPEERREFLRQALVP